MHPVASVLDRLGRGAAGAKLGREEAALELGRWVQAELAPWQFFKVAADGFEDLLQQVADEDASVFRFSLHDRRVIFHPKPEEECVEKLGSVAAFQHLLGRAELYRSFLQAVVTALDIRASAEFLIDLDDLSFQTSAAPVFQFQKVRGSHAILLPDVDFLAWNFYLGDERTDGVPFDEKLDQAIFAGSTTGKHVITREMVEQLAHQRLRSAVFFKRSSDVIYELPGIVQCDSMETEDMIRALDVSGGARSWPDQFRYRYLISVDGNGATCSRVVISLKSNSVLLKYQSVNDLYYFHGLTPWRHYIPVIDDAEVDSSLTLVSRSPGLARDIAERSTDFFKTRLSRIAVMHYMGELLNAYAGRFGTQAPLIAENPVFALDSFAHVHQHGDMWSQPNGWLEAPDQGWIEGIVLIPGPDILSSDLSYRAVFNDGNRSDEVSAWQLCGSRGESRPLCGFLIALRGASARRFNLHYEAVFADGTRVGPIRAGKPCVSPSRAPLSGYRLIVHRRL